MRAAAFWEDRAVDPVKKYTPGDEISDSHPKRDWLVRSGIAVAEPVDDEPHVEQVASEVGRESEHVDDDVPAAESSKPKPTDSVDAHRKWLKARGVDVRGLTRPQMIKVIAGMDE